MLTDTQRYILEQSNRGTKPHITHRLKRMETCCLVADGSDAMIREVIVVFVIRVLPTQVPAPFHLKGSRQISRALP